MESFFLGKRKFGVFEGVYAPSDDSFLLLDALKAEKPATALDLGCGSGIIGLQMLMNGSSVLFADIQEKCQLK